VFFLLNIAIHDIFGNGIPPLCQCHFPSNQAQDDFWCFVFLTTSKQVAIEISADETSLAQEIKTLHFVEKVFQGMYQLDRDAGSCNIPGAVLGIWRLINWNIGIDIRPQNRKGPTMEDGNFSGSMLAVNHVHSILPKLNDTFLIRRLSTTHDFVSQSWTV
jgi:hypothetical protein